jgi:hypothetical protein
VIKRGCRAHRTQRWLSHHCKLRFGAGPDSRSVAGHITTAVRLAPRRYFGALAVGGGGTMMALDFWARPDAWPLDPDGYVFLARAVEEIGRAMFGQDWTGKEVTTEHVRSLPDQAQGTVGDASYAHDVLMKLPKYSKQLPSAKTVLPPSLNSVLSRPAGLALFQVDSFTTEQWSAAQAAVRRQQKERAPALQRLSQVQLNIVKRCESGELISAIRSRAGGDMREVPRDWWNTESWHNRFTMCQLNPEQPFGIGVAGDNYCWIFFTRESLDKYLQKVSPPATAGQEKAAVAELARVLKANRNLTRGEARKHLESTGRIGTRAFQRIWPLAREAAGLPPGGAPGRKPRQSSR